MIKNGYAIELFFRAEISNAIKMIWEQFKNLGYGTNLCKLGSEPHIALSVHEDNGTTENDCTAIAEHFAKTVPEFSIQIEGVGSFDTKEGVVYTKIKKTDVLMMYHKTLHTLIMDRKINCNKYYVPGNWIPHCTLGINIKKEAIPKAIDLASKLISPRKARIYKAAVIKFRPVKSICEYTLSPYQPNLHKYIGDIIDIVIDRKINSAHPIYKFTYRCNYGFVPKTMNLDGKEIDAYLLGFDEPICQFTGRCIGVIHRYDDYDDKLIIVPDGKTFTKNEIRKSVFFQEKYFEFDIITD